MKFKRENRELVKKVALEIKDLLDEVVFAGSSILEFLIDKELRLAIHLRRTEDVDLVVEISNISEFYKIIEKLKEKGFKEDLLSTNICRLKKDFLQIDVIPTKKEIVGFTNSWFQKGVKKAKVVSIEGLELKILSPPYFLATKLEAFLHRGIEDPLTSKDLEDIIDLAMGSKNLLAEIKNENDEELNKFLSENIKTILKNVRVIDAIYGHFYDNTEIAKRIIEKLGKITKFKF